MRRRHALHPHMRIAHIVHLGAETGMRFEPGAVGQIDRLSPRCRRPRSACRRAAIRRASGSARGIGNASGDAGIGRGVRQQRVRARAACPTASPPSSACPGSNRHHRGFGALRHVADRRAGLRSRPGFDRHRRRFEFGGLACAGLASGCLWRARSKLRLRRTSATSGGPTASFGASTARRLIRQPASPRPASRRRPGRLALGDAAANLSLNISEAEDGLGRGNLWGPPGSNAKTSLKVGRTGRATTMVDS